jgi:predicted ATPase
MRTSARHPPQSLVGRRAEIERIDRLLNGVSEGKSASLVLRGEAGIGKSALLRHAEGRANECNLTVLRASGVQSESELAFCGLADLLRPLLSELQNLPGPQAAALTGALALGPPLPGDRFAIGTATLSLLALAAEKRPVVALVDDAHWLDSPSLSTLVFVARRLKAEGVLLIFAERMGEAPGLESFDGVVVEGLDDMAARSLLQSRRPPLASGVVEAVKAAAAGNPLALLEVPAPDVDLPTSP